MRAYFDWLIDWCLPPTLAVFQLYRGVILFINLDTLATLLFFFAYVEFKYLQGRIQDFKLGGGAKKADFRISLLPLTSNSKNKTVVSKLHCMSNL